MPDTDALESLIGGDILSLITAGMYDNPLAIYREYIQNAADALASVGGRANGKVEIDIDLSALRVRIRDNGPGLSREAAVRALLPIARSQKRRGIDRGFRGIGRLSGLAFAESVTFTTRARSDQPVTRIIWDGPKLRNRIIATAQTGHAIRECVSVESFPGQEYPAHFFEVEVIGVGRHAMGLILNRDAVQTYIGEVCPVPMSPMFPFSSKVKNLFGKDESPLALKIILDGELAPITRRYGGTIRFSKDRDDYFTEFEEIDIPSADGTGSAAIGWVAHSSYFGAIPKEAGIRGVRARVGNIQIGDETVFDRLFPEERFNRWCVSEIHILDPRIIPNGRRDYFEPGPHIRNLENQLSAILRGIAARCRKASAMRNNERKVLSALSRMEETYDLAVSGYLSPEDAKALIGQALNSIPDIRESIGSMNGYTGVRIEKLDAVETKLRNFQVRRGRLPFGGIPVAEITIYRRVFQALAAISQSPRTAKETIETVLTQT